MYGGNIKEDLTSNDQKLIPVQSIKRYPTHKGIKLRITQIHVITRQFQPEVTSFLSFLVSPSEQNNI